MCVCACAVYQIPVAAIGLLLKALRNETGALLTPPEQPYSISDSVTGTTYLPSLHFAAQIFQKLLKFRCQNYCCVNQLVQGTNPLSLPRALCNICRPNRCARYLAWRVVYSDFVQVCACLFFFMYCCTTAVSLLISLLCTCA